MSKNPWLLQYFRFLLDTSIKFGNNKLIALLCLVGICWTNSVRAESLNWQKQDLMISAGSPTSPQVEISGVEVQQMTEELTGLIGRFQATLLTAEAQNPEFSSNNPGIFRRFLKSTRGPVAKTNLKSAQNYENSHLALRQAKTSLAKFHQLIKSNQHAAARAEWQSAKQILWANYPQDQSIAQSEVRGMWLDRGTIVRAKSEADLAEVFDRMAIAGINTVFFETINSSYTIYPSEVAPEQNPLVKGWDPLKAATKLAHERGMELHAWVWTFAAVNQRHNTILNLPRNYLGPVLSKHPEWAMTDHEGSRFHYTSGKVFFDPANPEVQEYLLNLIAEIAQKYDVDGIHLDYIRYPFQSPTGKVSYGYGLAAREQFFQRMGLDPMLLTPYHPLWSYWVDFRIEQIDNFVAHAAHDLKQINPELVLSTAVFPIPQQERLTKIQQSWEKWVRKEWIDLLVPMTYAQSTEKLYDLTSPLLTEFSHGKALLLPGIRLLNISEVGALDQMQLLRGMTTQGYSLFAAENLNNPMTKIFSRTQGHKEEQEQYLPHRQPFKAALSRYQILKREWSFYQAQYNPRIDQTTLKIWQRQAEQLETKLNKLIDQPSSRNFLSAQIVLSSMRQQFPNWMRRTGDVEFYQAQAWQNRLDTLDRLLRYGERKNIR